MKMLSCTCVAAIAALPAIARAQSPAVHHASPVGAAPASCRSAASWDGAYDFTSQSLTTMDTSIVRATELTLLNQRIARAVRATLGGSDTLLPRADSLAYPDADGSLPVAIVVHRDAPATWHVDAGADSAGARLAKLYGLVLGTMAPNDLWISWPTGATRDAAEVRVQLHTQMFGALNADQSSDKAVPIFRTLHPVDPNGPPVLARGGPFVPSSHIANGRVGWRVVMEATIDADGNVEKTTVHDVRSLASASDSAHFDDDYKKLVDAARQAILHSKYVPAHHNGCAVEQAVQQSFYVNPGALR